MRLDRSLVLGTAALGLLFMAAASPNYARAQEEGEPFGLTDHDKNERVDRREYEKRMVEVFYFADKNKDPPSLDALVAEKYLRAIPVDPITNSAETWQTTTAEPDLGNPAGDVGIFDVKSGSDRVAIDGTNYADW